MTVLICLDYSKATDIVLKEAHQYLKAFPEQEVYVHMVKDISVLSYDQGFDNSLMNMLDQEAEEIQKKAEAVFGNSNVNFSTDLAFPVESILKRAGDLNCDLLILGTHGRTGIDHLLMGSVAEHVLRRTKWKTLIIPVKEKG